MNYNCLAIFRLVTTAGRRGLRRSIGTQLTGVVLAGMMNSCGADDEEMPIIYTAETQDQGQQLSLTLAQFDGISLNQSLENRISGVRITVQLSCSNIEAVGQNRRRFIKRIENYNLGETVHLTAGLNCEEPRLKILKISFHYTTVNMDKRLVRLTEKSPIRSFRGNSISLTGNGPSTNCEYFLSEKKIHITPETTIILDREELL